MTMKRLNGQRLNIKKYLKISSPDIALLQEIKTEELSYPFDELNKLGITFDNVGRLKP